MKLNDLDKTNVASRALKENFSYNFDASKLNKMQAHRMLTKIRGLISESRKTPSYYDNHSNSTHMKLVFMEQALSSRVNFLNSLPKARIVVENEEVEKSQVILAAQDMVDSVQKMIEDVSDMLVKELPALVDSIQSEIGANESEQFNSQVAEALGSLNSSLQETQSTLKGALNSITGQGGPDFDAGMGLGGEEDELGADMDMDMDVDADMGDDLDMGDEELPPMSAPKAPLEEPEPRLGGAGRPKR